MGELIRKSHNVSLLMYHFVFVAKYRRLAINEEVDILLRDISLEISKRYAINFLEIGTEGDHVHFLIQSVSIYSSRKIVITIKSITAREIFSKVPSVRNRFGVVSFGLTAILLVRLVNMQMKILFDGI